jgi:hypothetical protein
VQTIVPTKVWLAAALVAASWFSCPARGPSAKDEGRGYYSCRSTPRREPSEGLEYPHTTRTGYNLVLRGNGYLVLKTRRLTQWAALGLGLWFARTGVAHAYLDPGTGSFLLQVLVGSLAGALYVGRLYWTKVKAFFSRRPTKGDADAGHP